MAYKSCKISICRAIKQASPWFENNKVKYSDIALFNN